MSSKHQLKIIEGNNIDLIFEIEKDIKYKVGRASNEKAGMNESKISLYDPDTSQQHAILSIVAGELIVEDNNSTNGVIVNHKRVTKSLLTNNDLLQIGSTVMKVVVDSKDEYSDKTFIVKNNQYSKSTQDFKDLAKKSVQEEITFDPELTMPSNFSEASVENDIYEDGIKIVNEFHDQATGLVQSPIEGLVGSYVYRVEILEGHNHGKDFVFFNDKISIGRIGDIMLDDPGVSKNHVQIEVINSFKFKIKDLGSQNGTFVNNIRIQTSSIGMEDKVKIGSTVLRFHPIEDIY